MAQNEIRLYGIVGYVGIKSMEILSFKFLYGK
jgi:hypothetical protein